MKRKINFFAFLLAFSMLLSFSMTAFAAYTPPFQIQAAAAIAIDLSTGDVVYEMNADAKTSPANLSNIMSAIVAIEQVEDLDATTATMKQYIQDTLYRTGSYLAGISLREELSVRKLLYAMMMQSACEAAMMIADAVGDGSQAYFVEQMNKKAAELGMTSTNFTNSYGKVEQGEYTSARDVAIMAQYAMELPGFMEIAGTASYDGGPTNMHEQLNWNNQNSLLVPGHLYYYKGVTGLKSSFDSECGRSVVATCTSGGVSYLVVILNAPAYDSDGERLSENLAFTQAAKLFDWLYSTFKVKTVVEQGKNITEVPLDYCWGQDYLRLMSSSRFTALFPVDIEASSVTYQFELPSSVAAPVKKGDKIGVARLVLANEVIGEIDLVAAETVERNPFLFALGTVGRVYSNFWFKYTVVFLVLLTAFYVAVMVMRNKNREKYKNVRRRRRL